MRCHARARALALSLSLALSPSLSHSRALSLLRTRGGASRVSSGGSVPREPKHHVPGGRRVCHPHARQPRQPRRATDGAAEHCCGRARRRATGAGVWRVETGGRGGAEPCKNSRPALQHRASRPRPLPELCQEAQGKSSTLLGPRETLLQPCAAQSRVRPRRCRARPLRGPPRLSTRPAGRSARPPHGLANLHQFAASVRARRGGAHRPRPRRARIEGTRPRSRRRQG